MQNAPNYENVSCKYQLICRSIRERNKIKTYKILTFKRVLRSFSGNMLLNLSAIIQLKACSSELQHLLSPVHGQIEYPSRSSARSFKGDLLNFSQPVEFVEAFSRHGLNFSGGGNVGRSPLSDSSSIFLF